MSPEDFEALYRARVGPLTRQVFAMTGNWPEAQDVVQEAFVRAWQHRASIDRAGHPEAWVRVTAMRLAVSRWRKQRNAALAWWRTGPSHATAPTEPFDAELIAGLQSLPEAQRQALVLHYLADQSIAEIAASLDVPVGTVKARLSRGRAALAAYLSIHHREGAQHV